MNRPSLRPALLVFAVVLPVCAAIVFLPREFTQYKRWLELAPDETALRLIVLVAILAKSLAAIAVVSLPLLLCARFVAPRTLRLVSLAISLSILGCIGVDLELQKNTGNHLSRFLPFLLDAETFVWAGQGFDAVPGLVRVARNLLFAVAPASVIAWLLERWLERSPARRGWVVFSVILGFVLVVLMAAPVLQRTRGAPGPVHHLNERMPWTWLASIAVGPSNMGETQRAAQFLFTQALPGLAEPRRLTALLRKDKPRRTPGILIVAVESLRYDAMDSATMPRLWSWSEQGIRLDHHYATSNASHYGMFALLYGRSPLFYFETLDSGERPTLPSQLREWGYSSHFLTCTDIEWREMDRFMGSRDFSVERFRAETLPACDREVISRAASLMEPGDRGPRFVLVFLMSTHFGYHYPAGAEAFQPTLSPPNALELDAGRDRVGLFNRYRNSAHFVDGLIGSLLDRVDSRETLVVVTGDHGESLFDDGTIAHSSLLSEIQTRVPLVMTGPGVAPGGVRRGPTDHSDLLPTLLARLGVERERLAGYPGRDLLGGAGPPFVPLVDAKARRSRSDLVALVSRRNRFAMRLDSERGELRILGKLSQNGRPSHEPVDEREGALAVRWLGRYLEQFGSP